MNKVIKKDGRLSHDWARRDIDCKEQSILHTIYPLREDKLTCHIDVARLRVLYNVSAKYV